MYLSLSLILIMALLGTMVEVARGKVCRVHGKRTLDVAVERLMTEYNRPFYDRYGLFVLEDYGEPFEPCMARYVGEILGGDNLYEGNLEELEIAEKHYIGEDGGKALENQIEAKMKRVLVDNAVQLGVRRQKSALSVEEAAREIDEKVERERQGAEAGIQLLCLMKLIDGVNCTSGNVQGETYFSKMFYRGRDGGESLGITETVVWNAMKGKLVPLDETLSQLTKPNVKQRFENQVKNVIRKTEEALNIMRHLGTKLATLNLGENPISVLEGNRQILLQTRHILAADVTEAEIKELETLWKNYDTTGICFSYNGITQSEKGEDPTNCFSDALTGGVLNLVRKDEESISSKELETADFYRKWYDVSNRKIDYGNRVQKVTNEQEVDLQGAMGGMVDISVSDYFLTEYVKSAFVNWQQKNEKENHCFDYELEYLISGEKSDEKNLEQMVNRLFLVRTVVNTTTIMASNSRRETAYAAASAAVGFTGIEPLIRFTQTMFLILWGMAEALVDVAGILHGKDVSLVKTQSQLKVKFSELFQIDRQYVLAQMEQLPKKTTSSFDYEDYAILFLLGNKREITYYRMMDIMQENLRLDGLKQFNLGMCVDSLRVKGVFCFPTKFFRMPQLQKMVRRELNQFRSEAITTMSYVAD